MKLLRSLALAFTLVVTLLALAPHATAHAAASGTSERPQPSAIGRYCITNPDGTCHVPCTQSPSQYNCDGADPYNSGCAPSGSVIQLGYAHFPGTATVSATMVTLYSNLCETRWVRVTPNNGSLTLNACITRLGDGVYENYPVDRGLSNCTSSNKYVNLAQGVPLWTDMVYAPYPTGSLATGSWVGVQFYSGAYYQE